MHTHKEGRNSDDGAEEARGTVIVPRKPSLSRRVAAAVVKMAQTFHSDILFSSGAIHIDAKSTLMAFILLDALKGQTLSLSARGSDSVEAVRSLLSLFKS